MSTLTNEDKIAIINQHKRNLDYSKYGLEISVIEENASSSPVQERLTLLASQIADVDAKLQALDAEIELLS
jgi:hypothetical protein